MVSYLLELLCCSIEFTEACFLLLDTVLTKAIRIERAKPIPTKIAIIDPTKKQDTKVKTKSMSLTLCITVQRELQI